MDVKKRLTELINDVLSYLPWGDISSSTASECADHLLANGVTVVQDGTDKDVPTKLTPVTERLPDVERLIAHWQSKADELKKSVEDACGEASTVSTYKWMHSLWRTVCEFVADLDDLATHCEINNYVENCEECGFCKKGEVAPVSWTALPKPPKEE